MATGTPFRHRLRVTTLTEQIGGFASVCTCGKGWDDIGAGVAHVRLARRWRYLGTEVHYDERYHMWEHALTGRRFAWLAERYEKDTLS